MPALSLGVGACAAKPKADEGESQVASAEAALAESEPASEGGGEEKEDPDSDPKSKLDLPLPEAMPEKMDRRPTCPSVSWCAPQAAAIKVAADEQRTATGCPALVTSEMGLPKSGEKKDPNAPSMMEDPVYRDLFLRSRVGPVGINAAETQARREQGSTDACCYSWTLPCPGGRAFTDAQQQPVFAKLHRGSGWSEGTFELEGSPVAKAEAAQQWLADARMEHASVASFGRVALELMALGAPAKLVEATHRAALDEIEHAKVCMAVARACGAEVVEPGAMEITGPRPADFGRFAADTFIEGCVGETIAALAVRRAAGRCGNPDLSAALERIAADEAEHAALAWRSVRWALDGDPMGVRAALRERAHSFTQTLRSNEERSTAGEGAGPSELHALGRLSPAELASARSDAWHGIIAPMLAELDVIV